MTIEFYSNYVDAAAYVRRINLRAYDGQPIMVPVRVRVVNPRDADNCGLRPMSGQEIRRGMTGYVVCKGLEDFNSEYRGTGLLMTRIRDFGGKK